MYTKKIADEYSENMADDISKNKQKISNKITEISQRAAGKVEAAVDNINEQTKEYSHKVEAYVQKKPFKAISSAILLGATIAIFIRGLMK
jgi:ElaB/YqjD/DUF883 family membrane-anchored ribosome-binding protein